MSVPVSKEELEKMTQDQVITLFLLLAETNALMVQNMGTLGEQHTQLHAQVKELRDKNLTQEAELLVLRSRV